MKTVPYFVLLGLVIGSSTVAAKCLNRPDVVPECRYPSGDSWCAEQGEGGNYAYLDGCLKQHGYGQSEKSVGSENVENITLGRCHMDNCLWSKTLNQNTVAQNNCGSLIQLELLSGESENEDELDYSKIQWNDTSHTVYLFCSKRLPSVIMESDGQYQVDVLDFWNGIPGVMESSAGLYRKYCHPGSDNLSDEDLAKQNQYSQIPDIEVTLKQPSDIVKVAQSRFNCQSQSPVTAVAANFDVEQAKAKAEAMKGQTLVFKSFYLGMPIEDALGLINHHLGLPQVAPNPIEARMAADSEIPRDMLIEFQDTADNIQNMFANIGREFGQQVPKETQKPYQLYREGDKLFISQQELGRSFAVADAQGRVIAFELLKPLRDRLFGSAGMQEIDFLNQFIEAYGIKSLDIGKNEIKNRFIESQTIGVQQIAYHRSPQGYEFTYYDLPVFFESDSKGMGLHYPVQSIRITEVPSQNQIKSNFD